ncbi:hypothetical protein [Mesorhizobium sp. INR15]|uniref:hypothetical protein n=1 Tax=Mesorhizobium sp. INR15 TaxID=2654248 RepID=UPI0021564DC4
MYLILSTLPGTPEYFGVLATMTPVALFFVAALVPFIFLLAIALTGAQALIFALIAEFFSLRKVWLHMLFGAAASAAGFALIWPTTVSDVNIYRWADYGVIAGAGLVAGLVYWLIAGRDAGFRRPLPEL